MMVHCSWPRENPQYFDEQTWGCNGWGFCSPLGGPSFFPLGCTWLPSRGDRCNWLPSCGDRWPFPPPGDGGGKGDPVLWSLGVTGVLGILACLGFQDTSNAFPWAWGSTLRLAGESWGLLPLEEGGLGEVDVSLRGLTGRPEGDGGWRLLLGLGGLKCPPVFKMWKYF